MRRQKGTVNIPRNIIDEIMSKHAAGASSRELAEEYGKPLKTIRNMVTRENNKKRRLESEQSIPKFQVQKPAVTLQEYKDENKRLKMENELLRDFLQLTERK
jgi:hypothetical protein